MNKKQMFLVLATVMLAVLAITIGCDKSSSDQAEMVKRGEYLVDLGSCNLCHTPKTLESGGIDLVESRLLSGHPEDELDTLYIASAMNDEGQVVETNLHFTQWSGPWGISFAANLTPDKITGIGNWSESNFIRTMRTGKHMGSGNEIMLPMPWSNFARLTDEDLSAIFAYLKSIKPIENRVPTSIPRDNTEVESIE